MDDTQNTDSAFQNNAVFFIEVEKIHPNPYQPRREFDEGRLNELASSIRMYGVLQPLVVTRTEIQKEDGGLATEYELIAGERRLRASKLAGLKEVPALIRATADDEKTKLELAIIENLQREDLNPIDRARAFQQLAEEFGFTHAQVAKKVGRSREYVSNTIRILALPEEIIDSIAAKKISEGHARPLLMLVDHPDQQNVLYREILMKKMTVRDAEKISRQIASDRVRNKDTYNPELAKMEKEASDRLGVRVHIDQKKDKKSGRIRIDYVDENELHNIMEALNKNKEESFDSDSQEKVQVPEHGQPEEQKVEQKFEQVVEEAKVDADPEKDVELGVPNYSDNPYEEIESTTLEDKDDEDHKDDEDTFSLDNFVI
jgi:ParB family chromosome partitioning protein